MISYQKRDGYVLIMTLLMIALIVGVITSLVDKSRIHSHYLKTIIDREKARQLAWSGVEIAKSQLTTFWQVEEKESADQNDQKEAVDPLKQAKQFLKNMLPVCNKWQTFSFLKKRDGVSGQVRLCLGSEHGKIDINQIFDFKQKKFINEGAQQNNYKKLVQTICSLLEKRSKKTKIFESLEEFLKKRNAPLYDPSEFLQMEAFKFFGDHIFFAPISTEKGKEFDQEDKTIYLNDIFTLWSSQKEINPWFFSFSLKNILNLNTKNQNEEQLEDKKLEKLLEGFKLNLSWQDSWESLLKPLYGKDFKQMPKEFQEVLSTKFEPSVFSVLSYGTVGEVTQKLLVILEQKKVTKTDKSGKKNISLELSAKKFYWL